MKKHQTEIRWQVLVYGIYVILALIQAYSEHPSQGILLKDVLGILSVSISECILVNVLGNWLMLKYPFSKYPKKYSIYFFLIMITFLGFRYFTAYPEYSDVLKTYSSKQDKTSLVFFFFISCINFVISFLVALGIFSIKKSLRMERKAHRLEREVNEARLTVLKHQINPHFLYNTLSYMYSQARPVSENLSKSILMLSDMMRYSLNKTDESGLTLIEKEIQYIENFIEIHRLRFEEDFYVNFEIEGIISGKKIVPLLLITFVENAFKHGKINDPEQPITIRISIEKGYLILFVENYKQQGIKDETSGIGLANTKKRLNLTYPKQHSLTIIDEANYFGITLKINFV